MIRWEARRDGEAIFPQESIVVTSRGYVQAFNPPQAPTWREMSGNQPRPSSDVLSRQLQEKSTNNASTKKLCEKCLLARFLLTGQAKNTPKRSTLSTYRSVGQTATINGIPQPQSSLERLLGSLLSSQPALRIASAQASHQLFGQRPVAIPI